MTSSRKAINTLAFTTGLLVLLNLFSFLFYTKRLSDDSRDSFQAQTVVDAAEVLRSTLIDAETGQRGYLLTGMEEFLEPYESAMSRIKDRSDYLFDFTREDPAMNALVLKLRSHIDNRIILLERHIQVRRIQGIDATRELVSQRIGKREMDASRAVLDDIVAMARNKVAARKRETVKTFHATLYVSVITSLMVFMAILVFLATVHRHTRTQEEYYKRVRESNELLSTTLKSIGDGVITTDSMGLIVDLNHVAEALTGWTTEAARGKHLSEVYQVVDQTNRARLEDPGSRLSDNRQITGMTNLRILTSRDEREFPIDDGAAPIRDASGSISGSVLVFRDVSGRRQIERQLAESEMAHRAIFELAPIGIANASLEGRIIRANQAFCELLESTQEEIVSKTFSELTHPDDLTINQDLVQQLLRNEIPKFTIEMRYINSRGVTRRVSVTATLLRDEEGNPQSFVAAVRDIEQLRQAEELRLRMSAIVNSTTDAVISKDQDGTVTSWNGAAEKLFGYSSEEMIGLSIFTIVPAERHDEEVSFLEQLRNGKSIDQYRSVRIHKSGRRIDVMLSIAPLHFADGRFMGISAIVKDLTAQLRTELELKESEQKFRTLADNISQFAWMADSKGWIYWYNQRWYDFTGTTLEEMQGWGWKKVHHPDHVDRVVESIQYCWDTGEPWEDTFPLRSREGDYRWFLSRALPIRDFEGNVIHWFGSNTDITELVEKEESLRKAQEEAESASRARGDFLANMSHEIRTPMTAILGHVEIMSDHLHDPDDIQSIQTIQNNGRYLLQIINDILDLSKIDSGNLSIDLAPVSTSHLLAEVHQLLHIRAIDQGIDFNICVEGSIPKRVHTDPIRLRQILLNLIGNAIKFTDKGKVTVECSFDGVRKLLSFSVTDTGIGISKTDLANLFQPFMQADTSSTRNFQGTGLGLAISKRLAHALGGDITVESELGKGSRFVLVIPTGNSTELQSAEFPPLHSPERSPRRRRISGKVLVVDDRRDIRILAQNFIEKAGGLVAFATNGQEAIEILLDRNDQSIDLVLMDMQMPVMDGYSASRELRHRGFRKPIIALTANAMTDDRIKCIECGCDDYAMKPLDSAVLIDMIAQHLGPS